MATAVSTVLGRDHDLGPGLSIEPDLEPESAVVVALRRDRPGTERDLVRHGADANRRAQPAIWYTTRVDRRLAAKNIRTGLIAGAISLIVFAAAFLSGYLY